MSLSTNERPSKAADIEALSAGSPSALSDDPLLAANEGYTNRSSKSFNPVATFAVCAIIFSLAAVISLRQNWQADICSTCMIYDAGHYEETVQLVVSSALQWMQRIPASAASTLGLKGSELGPHLLLDGPFLPITSSIVWLVTGHIPTAAEWRTFVGIETFWYATSCVLMFLLSKRLLRSSKLAIASAIAWMLYPSAVIGAGTFMTEGPIGTLLMGILYGCTIVLESLPSGFSSSYTSSELIGETNLPSGELPVASTSVGLKGVLIGALIGLASALLFVSKPALAPALALVLGAYTWRTFFAHQSLNGRGRVLTSFFGTAKVLAPLIVAFCLVAGAWISFSYNSSGRVYIGANRVPTFNIVKGTEPTTDGWGTFPQTPIALAYPETISPGQAFREIWQKYPADCANLYARKLERLWGMPWNDYHYKFFSVTVPLQIWWHRLLVIAGILGSCIFVGCFKRFTPAGRFIGLSALGIIAAHSIFIPFETMSRYNFTAMPFIALMALTPLSLLRSKTQAFLVGAMVLMANIVVLACSQEMTAFLGQVLATPSSTHWAAWVVSSGSFLALAACAWYFIRVNTHVEARRVPPESNPGVNATAVVNWPADLSTSMLSMLVMICSVEGVAHIAHKEELREWSATVRNADVVSRRVALPDLRAENPDWVLLLIDGDKNLERAVIEVNGHRIQSKPQNLLLFNNERAIMLDGLQLWARLCRQNIDGLRQWRAVPVPLGLLAGQTDNIISIRPPANFPVTIYGDFTSTRGTVSLPSLKYLSGGRSLHEIQSFDMRTSEYGTAFRPEGMCALVRGEKPASSKDLSPAQGKQFGSYRIYFAFGFKTAPAEIPVAVNPFILSGATIHQDAPLSLSPAAVVQEELNNAPQLRATLRVGNEQLKEAGVTGGQFLLHGKSGEDIFLPGEPQSFAPDPTDPSKSLIQVDFASHSFSTGLQSVRLNLSSVRAPFDLKNTELTVAPLGVPSFINHRVVLR